MYLRKVKRMKVRLKVRLKIYRTPLKIQRKGLKMI